MQPKILFEDESLLVLDKPSGITVNRSDTTAKEETLQDWVEDKYPISNIKYQMSNDTKEGEYKSPEEVFYERVGIVHRLDKETSGIILVAKNPVAFATLQSQFKERIVKKVYIALVHGTLTPSSGEVRVPVGRLSFNRKRFGVVAGGRESITRYQVIKNLIRHSGKRSASRIKEGSWSSQDDRLSLVELYPQSGRTHQIRVHMKYLNHPLFSDELYAGRKTARQDRKVLQRLFLHASKITFVHPITKKEISIECPLPQDLQVFLESLTPRATFSDF